MDEELGDNELGKILDRAVEEFNVKHPAPTDRLTLVTLKRIGEYVERMQKEQEQGQGQQGASVTAQPGSGEQETPGPKPIPTNQPDPPAPPPDPPAQKPLEILRLEAEEEEKRENRRSGVRILLTQLAGAFLFGGGFLLALLALFAPDSAELSKAITDGLLEKIGKNTNTEGITKAIQDSWWIVLTADGIQNAKDIFILVSPTAAMVIAFWFSGRKPKAENQSGPPPGTQ